jgi:hypothetical protein
MIIDLQKSQKVENQTPRATWMVSQMLVLRRLDWLDANITLDTIHDTIQGEEEEESVYYQ